MNDKISGRCGLAGAAFFRGAALTATALTVFAAAGFTVLTADLVFAATGFAFGVALALTAVLADLGLGRFAVSFWLHH